MYVRPKINQIENEDEKQKPTETVQFLISVDKLHECDDKHLQIKCKWFLIFAVISIRRIS